MFQLTLQLYSAGQWRDAMAKGLPTPPSGRGMWSEQGK